MANGGSWAPFSSSDRQLHYFVDPAAWLQARGLYEQHSNLLTGGISGPLGTALNSPQADWGGPVTQAVADLDRAGLASVPLQVTMSAQGVFAPRTSEKGRRFLAFLNEPDSTSVDAPSSL